MENSHCPTKSPSEVKSVKKEKEKKRGLYRFKKTEKKKIGSAIDTMKWCADICINCKCCRWKSLSKTDVIYLTKLCMYESSWATSLRLCQVVANYPWKLERGSPPTHVGSGILRSRLLTVHPFPPFVSVEGFRIGEDPTGHWIQGAAVVGDPFLGVDDQVMIGQCFCGGHPRILRRRSIWIKTYTHIISRMF